jgi:hypothetical protein
VLQNNLKLFFINQSDEDDKAGRRVGDKQAPGDVSKGRNAKKSSGAGDRTAATVTPRSSKSSAEPKQVNNIYRITFLENMQFLK